MSSHPSFLPPDPSSVDGATVAVTKAAGVRVWQVPSVPAETAPNADAPGSSYYPTDSVSAEWNRVQQSWSPDDVTIVLTMDVDMDPIVLLADGPLSIVVS